MAQRYGGEEFLIILPQQSLQSTSAAAERLRKGLEDLAISHEAKTSPRISTISISSTARAPGEKNSEIS
jgi:diguanylate cyclase (GGDEF)-like protein